MLRHALRRLLLTLPTLIGVSVVAFFVLSYVPDPTDDPAVRAALSADEIALRRRDRFLDLPRFVNTEPADVSSRAASAIAAITGGAPDEVAPAETELVRLGGAALPHVLPELDALPPKQRVRVALALAPIARRMGIAGGGDVDDAARAVAFWTRFWDDRGVEFRTANVRTAVSRLVRYGAASRAADLIELDTFALDDVIAALDPPRDEASLGRVRALVDVAAHVTGRADRIELGDELDAARACVDRWQAFWAVYRSDFVVLSGAARAGATILETRYGKWALDAATHRLGRLDETTAILDVLARRAPVTLAIVSGAISLAYPLAVLLGMLGAARRGRRVDTTMGAVTLAFYALPTAVAASIVARVVGADRWPLFLAIGVLALSLVAAPASQQRAALVEALGEDYVAAATARGASPARALVVHALRNALLPVVTLAALEAPTALGGAFVVERVFDLRGLGETTILAVQHRDVAWLMALSILTASAAAIFVILTDLGYVLVDPRVGPAITGRRRRGS